MSGWIGVDLDGTLAHYEATPHWDGSIGEPILPMVNRVRMWLAAGKDVRIMTARVAEVPGVTDGPRAVEEQRKLIEDWCFTYFRQTLPITCSKDYHMSVLWDDRCVQVIPNTGIPAVELAMGAEAGQQ